VPGSGNRAAGPFLSAGDYNQNNILNKSYIPIDRHYRVNSLYASADLGFRNYLFLTTTVRNDWFSTLNITRTITYILPVAGSFVFSDVVHLPAWISSWKGASGVCRVFQWYDPYQNALTYGLQSYTDSGRQLGFVAGMGLSRMLISGR